MPLVPNPACRKTTTTISSLSDFRPVALTPTVAVLREAGPETP